MHSITERAQTGQLKEPAGKEGKRLGKKVGLIPLRSLSARVDTRDEVGLFLARHLTLAAALR